MINDLEIKKCLYLVLAILLAMAGLVGLAALGLDIPVLRQIVGFVFLTFVPGVLILRILKIHNISVVESLVYSVGLSLAFVMFAGSLVNLTLPLFGIARPISILPLMATFVSLIVILGVVAYRRDRDYLPPSQADSPSVLFSPPVLFLLLVSLLAVLGAFLVSYYQNNILLLIFILVVAAVAGLVAFGKFIREKTYPLAIIVIAVSLLYATAMTLASRFLVGGDLITELLCQNLVTQNGYWNPAIWGSVNTTLSIVILCPVYSVMLDMDAVWVFKIIYPWFFCLVPLALFHVYRQQIGSRRAFFSVFFFMSLINVVGGLGYRQLIAELFFALLILLMVDRRLTSTQKSALAIIFAMSITVSHYGLAYVCFAYFVLGWFLLKIMKNKTVIHWWSKLMARFGGTPADLGFVATIPESTAYTSILNGNLVALYLVFSLTWYIFVSSGTPFYAVINIGQHIFGSVGELFNPLAKESLVVTAVGADFPSVSTLGRAFRIFQLTTQFFIIVGFIRLFLKPKGFKFKAEYIALVIISALILFACIVVPYFSGHLEVERFYQITLFLLSPLCILGGETVWEGLSSLFRSSSSRLKFKGVLLSPPNSDTPGSIYFRLLTLGVLIPYFLFTTGFIFEITRSEEYNVVSIPSSEALSSYRIDMKGMNHREHAAMEWLSGVVNDKAWIYADQYGYLQRSLALYGQVGGFGYDAEQVPKDVYIYLRTWNIAKNEVVIKVQHGEHIKLEYISFDALPGFFELINSKNLVYNSGGARILAPLMRGLE